MKYKYKDLDLELIFNYKPQNKHVYLRSKGNIVIINSFKRFTEKDVNRILDEFYDRLKIQINTKKVEDSKNPSIHVLGKEYVLLFKEDKCDDVDFPDDVTLLVHTKSMDISYNRLIIQDYYVNLLKSIVSDEYPKLLSDFKEIIVPPKIKFSTMKTSYGKYNRKNNVITLSISIAKYNIQYIRLVMAHELTHVLYMNHQKEFYDRLDKVIPNAKRYQHMLRKIKYNDYF